MPWMWGFDIPTHGGGTTALKNLMDGMLIMRGVNTHNSAHLQAAALHYRPNSIPASFGGMAADNSTKPIAAVEMGCVEYRYRSQKGSSPINLQAGDDMLSQLLSPFIKKNLTGYSSNQSKVAAALEIGLDSLSSLSLTNDPISNIVKKNMESATELFSSNFGNLETAYNNLYIKYKNLITRVLDPSNVLVGINDKPVGASSGRGREYCYSSSYSAIRNDDLRTIITSGSNLDALAQRFAVTEFVILNGLSSNVCFDASNLKSLNIPGGQSAQITDSHFGGTMPNLIINTYADLSFSACLYEFISQLKAHNIYEKTVIDYCGEFGRIPIDSGEGSDHCSESNANMLLSGAINGSHVIGNISANKGAGDGKTAATGHGTWGRGAINGTTGLLDLNHFTSTLSNLMGLPSPITSTPSLVREENGKFVPILPTGKIIV